MADWIQPWIQRYVTRGGLVHGYDENHSLPADMSQVGWQADGSFRLPYGEVLPASASTVVDINGKKVPLPFMRDAGQGANAEDTINRIVGRLSALDRSGRGWGASGSVTDGKAVYTIIRGVIEDKIREGADPRTLGFAAGDASGVGNHWQKFLEGSSTVAGTPGQPGQSPAGTAPAPPGGTQLTPATQPAANTPGGDQTGGGMGPSLIPGVPGGPLPASTGAKNIALQDPKMALDYVMQQMGINTDRPGIFTDQIEQAMGDLLTPYTQLAGIWEPGGSPAAYADNPQYYLGQFAQNMQGGHGYAGLANMANQIGGDPRWNRDIIGSLGAKAAINAMQNRMFLGNAGTNPLYNQARAARWASAFGDKYHPGAFGRASADNPNLQPADWLAGSPWKDLLNNY